ncbi:hypothetical protein ACJIZ3_007552 [Penstemon smallii]|uniref:Uncharacterized protein n=1 Tax=Penstemon smallii TaxID=265156 RepID=A0ABD3T898_9LAMI
MKNDGSMRQSKLIINSSCTHNNEIIGSIKETYRQSNDDTVAACHFGTDYNSLLQAQHQGPEKQP